MVLKLTLHSRCQMTACLLSANFTLSMTMGCTIATFSMITWTNPSDTYVFLGLLEDMFINISSGSRKNTWAFLEFTNAERANGSELTLSYSNAKHDIRK